MKLPNNETDKVKKQDRKIKRDNNREMREEKERQERTLKLNLNIQREQGTVI